MDTEKTYVQRTNAHGAAKKGAKGLGELPGIGGIKAMSILREDPATAHIPVVALSANAMPHDIAKGMQAGFFGYLTKPIHVKEFMETLNAALEFAEGKAAHTPHAEHAT